MGGGKIRGLVLDRQHRVLLDEQGLAPELAGEWPARPFAAYVQFVRERYGLLLPSPGGSMVPGETREPFALLFFVDAEPAPPMLRWVPLEQALQNDWLWRAYVTMVLAGWEPPTRKFDVFCFGAGLEVTGRLAHLVVCGDKRITTSWPPQIAYDDATTPVPGLISIVTDGFGLPRCAIRTLEVHAVRFGDVHQEWAETEAEGDRSLDYWREGHRECFGDDAKRIGVPFNDDEMVLIEKFSVIHVIGRVDPVS